MLCPKTEDLYTKVRNSKIIRMSIFRADFHAEFRYFGGYTTLDDVCELYRAYMRPNIIIMTNNNEEFGIWHMVWPGLTVLP